MCFITPTKWISGGQDTFDKVRHALVDEKHLKSMVDYMDAKRIFKDRSIAGGVSYFLFDKEYNGSTEFTTVNDKLYTDNRNLNAEDIIPRHFVGETVISKVKAKATGYLSSYVTKDLWDLPTNFNGNAVKTKDNEVEVITPRGSSYIEYEYACPYRDTYKVMFTRVIPEHAVEPDKNCKYGILSSVKVLEPNQICNASYMVVNSISKKEYAENIKAYLETKFARFLILQTLFGIGLTTDRFKFVPVVDFSKKWTDVDLYSYFELDDSEIEFIEKIIKPITTNSNSNSQQQTTPQPEPQQTTQKPKFTRQDGEAALINQKIQQNN
jgi:site-specific DNA-methyltransferase (adenine-specific)